MELEDLDFEQIMERLKSLASDRILYSSELDNMFGPGNINFYNQMEISEKAVTLSKRVIDVLLSLELLREINTTAEIGWKKYKIISLTSCPKG
jgi:hypothetical protein